MEAQSSVNVPGFVRPPCTPCKPTQPMPNINCNCRNLTSLQIPNVPGLMTCLRILELLCKSPGSAQGTVNDFLAAMTATTQCMLKLTSLNLNSTDLNGNGGGQGGGDGSGSGGGTRPGGRLLEQLLGGLGQNLDTLLAGLLGTGAKPGGGLLGQILSGGNLG